VSEIYNIHEEHIQMAAEDAMETETRMAAEVASVTGQVGEVAHLDARVVDNVTCQKSSVSSVRRLAMLELIAMHGRTNRPRLQCPALRVHTQ